MSLPQLVGLPCVVCQRTLSSVLDARFCEACGNPTHRECFAPQATEGQAAAEGRCNSCGGDPASAVAVEVRAERIQLARDARRPQQRRPDYPGSVPTNQDSPSTYITESYPVSKACPSCGHTEYKSRKPETWVAFTWDRVCKACATRYTPPTPTWAAVVFLFAGLLLILGCGLVGVISLLFRGDVLNGGIGCALGFMGLLAFAYGIRALTISGRANASRPRAESLQGTGPQTPEDG